MRLVWHYGYWPTFSALILKAPERRVTLILLATYVLSRGWTAWSTAKAAA